MLCEKSLIVRSATQEVWLSPRNAKRERHPQQAGWPAIAAGGNTLILAPTGTGKTLAAFLWELNALITRRPRASARRTRSISSTSRRSRRSTTTSSATSSARSRSCASASTRAGEKFPEIRVAVRTGDTPASARARMLRKTPHILITTPESLHILLTSRARTRHVQRAARRDRRRDPRRRRHEARRAPRAHARAPRAPRRSPAAAHRPLRHATSARGDRALPRRQCARRARDRRLRAREEDGDGDPRLPSPTSRTSTGRSGPSVGPLVLDRIRAARTTLVFVNNRAQAEKIAARVNTLAGEEIAQPYHGSLSRERRLMLEQRLKAGDAARARHHELPRAGHRHRLRRPRDPAPEPEARRGRAAARRTRRTHARRREPRRLRPDLPRRRDRADRDRPRDARRRRRADARRAQRARRARAGHRRRGVGATSGRAPSCSSSYGRRIRTRR